jgi:hypothetical protein
LEWFIRFGHGGRETPAQTERKDENSIRDSALLRLHSYPGRSKKAAMVRQVSEPMGGVKNALDGEKRAIPLTSTVVRNFGSQARNSEPIDCGNEIY